MSIRKAFLMLFVMIATLAAPMAFAAEGAVSGDPYVSFASLGAALALGIAALGGALAQGRTATAALEGIARNPAAAGKLFLPMIIGLALIESLVLYAFVIAFLKIR